MWVYITGCLASVVMMWFTSKVKYKRESAWHSFLVAFFSALPLIYIATIRYNVGKDYMNYKNLFIRIADGSNRYSVEPLYLWLNKGLAAVGFDYVSVFFATSFIFLLFIFLAIYNDSPNRMLSAFLVVCTGFYFTFMNGTRQMMACAILLWPLKYVKEKKFVPYLITVVIAAGFHYTSLIFIVAYFIGNWTINRKWLIALTGMAFLLSTPLANLLNRIISSSYYSGYVGGQFDVEAKGYVTLLITAAIMAFATVFYEDSAEYKLYYNLQAVALVLAGLNGKVVLVNRIRWIFGLPVIILVPLAISNIKNEKARTIITAGIVILYAIYFYYTIGINNSNNVLPYDTIFNHIN